jgi:hypothetical protein
MKLLLLRGLLVADAAILFLLGGLLVVVPGEVLRTFHIRDLPPVANYLVGMWGCLLGTMGFGYLVAASHPLRHRVWINIGIIRGALECALGVFYMANGSVTVQQAALGTLVAGLIGLAYVILYPRSPRAVPAAPAPAPA